jgi:hypothetical protein
MVHTIAAALEADKRGLSAEALDRINREPRAKKPSFLGSGLKIAASGVNAAASYRKNVGG